MPHPPLRSGAHKSASEKRKRKTGPQVYRGAPHGARRAARLDNPCCRAGLLAVLIIFNVVLSNSFQESLFLTHHTKDSILLVILRYARS